MTQTQEVVHLHNHSSHSFLDGQSSVKKMVARAKELGLDSIALTNHGNIFGIPEFYQECKKAGIKPILGCLVRGQEIMTSNGVKSVEDIRVGDMVLTHKGRFRRVLQTSRRIHDGKLYDIELSGHGGRKLTLTDEHPVLIRDRSGEYNWVRADEIIAGRPTKHLGIKEWNSYVGLPKLENKNKDRTAPVWIQTEDYLPNNIGFINGVCQKVVKTNKYESKTQWPRIKKKLKLSGDLSYFLGLFAAEGSYGKYDNGTLNGGMVLSFHIDEDEYAEEVQRIVFNNFGLTSTIKKRPEKTIQEVFFNCLPLAHIISGLLGVGSYNKKIPKEIMEATPKVRRHFLQGLLDGDGKNPERTSNIGRQSTLKVASKNLAWGCRQLLADEGHWTNVAEVTEDGRTYYQVPCNFKRRYARSIEDDNYVWKPIKTINVRNDIVEVFNFEVEEDNSYVSDFILHNCEFYLVDDDQKTREAKQRHAHHLVVLAENEEGWHNICKLTTLANRHSYYKPRIDFKMLEQHREGLIVLTACMHGPISYWLFDKMTWASEGEESKLKEAANIPEAYRFGRELLRILGPNRLFLEVQDGGIPEQLIINQRVRKMADELGLKTVATQDAHYVNKEDATAHSFLKAMAWGKFAVPEGESGFSTNEFYLKNREQVLQDSDILPEEVDRTREIAARCNVELPLHQIRLPQYPGLAEGQTSIDLLKEKLNEGWIKRDIQDDAKQTYKLRLHKEVNDIEQAGLADYFLIVWDILDYCHRNDIMVGGGRGSAAGSLVSYLLHITELDPIHYNLIWERFYNAGRKGSMPDIDTDIEKTRRDEVIAYIRERFGTDRVAQLVTLSSLGAKGVLKDVFRVAGIDFDTANRISGLVPAKNEDHTNVSLREACEMTPLLKEYAENDERLDIVRHGKVIRQTSYKELFEIAERLEGCYKTTGVHAAAVVIADDEFDKAGIPLVKGATKEELICGWDMDAVDAFGLLKVDILGLATLSVVKTTLGLIKERHNIEIDINNIPLDDPKVADLIARGYTDGIFQLSSNLGKSWSQKCKPRSVEEIAELSALLRPACLETNMTATYAKIKAGEESPSYIHEKLKPILEPTRGVLIYQEQMMAIAHQICGWDLKECDKLRKVVGKKKPEELRTFREKFVNDATVTVGEENAEEVWSWIEKAGGYGFNASHAIAYSLLSYQTAWLKANYYIEFLCANLIHARDQGGQKTPQEVIAGYINDAKLHDVAIIPPTLDGSDIDFTIINESTISYGFSYIKNVGSAALNSINVCKQADSFADFLKLAKTAKLNKQVVEALICAGVLDKFNMTRRSMKNQYALLNDLTAKELQCVEDMNGSLVDRISVISNEDLVEERKAKKLPVPNIRRREKLRNLLDTFRVKDSKDTIAQVLMWEDNYLGATISGSRADLNRNMNARNQCIQIAKGELQPKQYVDLCVVLEGLREHTIKKGNNAGQLMGFLTVSDSSFRLDNVVMFSDSYNKIKGMVDEGDVVSARGIMSDRGLIINSLRRV